MNTPDGRTILFSIRASTQTFFGEAGFTESTFGTISFDRGALIVDGGWRLPWADIECIKGQAGGVHIKHHCPSAPRTILAHRFFLFRKLQDAVKQHGIDVKMEP